MFRLHFSFRATSVSVASSLEDEHLSLSAGDEEVLSGRFPRELVRLRLEILRVAYFPRPPVHQVNAVVLVSETHVTAVRRPTDVDILACKDSIEETELSKR